MYSELPPVHLPSVGLNRTRTVQREQLGLLLEEVIDARSFVLAVRSAGSGEGSIYAARRRVMLALESYIGAIEALSWPVPPGLRRERDQTRSLLTNSAVHRT